MILLNNSVNKYCFSFCKTLNIYYGFSFLENIFLVCDCLLCHRNAVVDTQARITDRFSHHLYQSTCYSYLSLRSNLPFYEQTFKLFVTCQTLLCNYQCNGQTIRICNSDLSKSNHLTCNYSMTQSRSYFYSLLTAITHSSATLICYFRCILSFIFAIIWSGNIRLNVDTSSSLCGQMK